MDDRRRGDLGIPHFVADNISWWYPVDQKKKNCAMLLRENKSLASAILDLDKQMQKMEQMLPDFCKKYAPINNPQSEVETQIDDFFLSGVRNAFNMGSAEKLYTVFCSILRCSTILWQPPASHNLILTTRPPSHLPPHPPAPLCCATHPCSAYLSL